MTIGIAEDVRDWLVAQGVTGTVMVGVLPTSYTSGIGVITYHGHAPVLAMGGTVVERMAFIQIHIRGTLDGMQALLTKVEDVFALVVFARDISINGHFYDKIVAINEPIQLKPESNELPVFLINIEAWRRGL